MSDGWTDAHKPSFWEKFFNENLRNKVDANQELKRKIITFGKSTGRKKRALKNDIMGSLYNICFGDNETYYSYMFRDEFRFPMDYFILNLVDSPTQCGL